MDENLQIAAGLLEDGADLLDREFARQRYPLKSEALRQLYARDVGDAHLGTGVKFEIGRDPAGEADDSVVLHDQSVDANSGEIRNSGCRRVQFVFEDQRIERHIAAHAALVKRPHHFRKLFQIEAHLGPRGKVLQAEVHGIRSGLDGSAKLRPITGRTHDFRFTRIQIWKSRLRHVLLTTY